MKSNTTQEVSLTQFTDRSPTSFHHSIKIHYCKQHLSHMLSYLQYKLTTSIDHHYQPSKIGYPQKLYPASKDQQTFLRQPSQDQLLLP